MPSGVDTVNWVSFSVDFNIPINEYSWSNILKVILPDNLYWLHSSALAEYSNAIPVFVSSPPNSTVSRMENGAKTALNVEFTESFANVAYSVTSGTSPIFLN